MSDKFPLFVVLMAVLLSGCAVHGPVADREWQDAWLQRQTSLSGLTEWGFEGRAVINDGRASTKVALHWQQQQGQFEIRLMSFFGQQQARFQGVNDGPVTLFRPGRPSLQAAGSMSLMQQELGWALPLDGLRFWVVGVPVPDRLADWDVDSRGRLAWLEQDGWRIEFASYQMVSGFAMPRKMRLYHASLQVRLVLDRWRVDGSQVLEGSTLPSPGGG